MNDEDTKMGNQPQMNTDSHRSEEVIERPILFSGEMVRAILAGRKTQTRRVVKFMPVLRNGAFEFIRNGEEVAVPTGGMPSLCPHGKPGDRLWGRETWAWSGDACDHEEVLWKADAEWSAEERGGAKWRPSIYMPRWASRITLEVTDVRVERVQEISEEDAEAEGVFAELREDQTRPFYFRDGFMCLWNQINEKRGFGWDVNPWVWVVRFKRLEVGS